MILDHCTSSARLFSLCLLACALSGEAQQIDRKFAACIEIRQSTPSTIFIDDSGTTTEPQQFVIKAYGNPEDLKAGEVVFLEDDREIKVIPVGDLKPGVQTLTVPAGLHARTSSGLFSYSLVRLDGTDAIGVSGIPMSSVGHVPARERKAPPKLKRDNHFADPGFEIATIDPDTDPNEAMAIAAFQPNSSPIALYTVAGVQQERRSPAGIC